MAEIMKVAEDAFKTEVLESETPVLVDFTAVWCGPCKQMDAIVKQLAGEWGEKVKFFKLDVDDAPQIAMDYNVMGVPTLMLFKGGQAVERTTGYLPKDRVEKKFAPHLG